jgi:hypothetical protein
MGTILSRDVVCSLYHVVVRQITRNLNVPPSICKGFLGTLEEAVVVYKMLVSIDVIHQ